MNRLSGPVPWTQRLVAILVWTAGLAVAAGVLVFGFFVGAALLGVAAIAGLIAWVRLRWGKPNTLEFPWEEAEPESATIFHPRFGG